MKNFILPVLVFALALTSCSHKTFMSQRYTRLAHHPSKPQQEAISKVVKENEKVSQEAPEVIVVPPATEEVTSPVVSKATVKESNLGLNKTPVARSVGAAKTGTTFQAKVYEKTKTVLTKRKADQSTFARIIGTLLRIILFLIILAIVVVIYMIVIAV